MPFKIDFKEDNGLIIITIEGVFLLDDFDKIMKQITESTGYPTNVNAIFDLTQMSFDNIGSDFLRSLSFQAEKAEPGPAGR